MTDRLAGAARAALGLLKGQHADSDGSTIELLESALADFDAQKPTVYFATDGIDDIFSTKSWAREVYGQRGYTVVPLYRRRS